jgi:UDP-N-acetylglucosamine 2-epimerase (non-hydrolysing)/GDP/UDP-N,N'-diacetylbacillosamine 2-epimerase (hydrolysing)
VEPDAVLVAYHPVTLARDTLRETDELFAALERMSQQIVFCFPNADAGSRELARRTAELCERRPRTRMFVNLGPVEYWSLLRCVGLMLGNSSSGIMETPSLRLPTVNVGLRQHGRQRAPNVLDVEPECEAILKGVARAADPAFRSALEGMENPYGDGRAAESICRVLADVPLGERLLHKRNRL